MVVIRLLVCFTTVFMLHSSINAQMGLKFRGSNGWCIGDRYDQMFVNSNQETFSGQVMSIDTVTPMRDMSTGIQFTLKTERSEEIKVQLGPSWYILNQDMTLSVNDKSIEVKGSRVMIEGKQVVMASMMVRQKKVLLLRDADGIPYWCAWRPRFK